MVARRRAFGRVGREPDSTVEPVDAAQGIVEQLGDAMAPGLSTARKLSAVIAVGLFAVGCSPPSGKSGPTASSAPASCTVSSLEKGPDAFSPYGLAHAGPLWFSAFGQVAGGTPARLAAGGRYDGWKVVIHPDQKSKGLVEVSGTACASGLPVRFCYTACSWENRSQTAVSRLQLDVSSHADYTGYMVFPGTGLMRLAVLKGSQSAGHTIIDVPSSSNG
jgi:hypothetical protein